MSKHKVAAGGSSTINGIDYQILGSLLEVTTVAAYDLTASDDGRDLLSGRFILEPSDGGGDLVIDRDYRPRALQYKARSGRGSWSFREVVTEVFPDLYIAVDTGRSFQYEFVTEGHRGDWMEVDEWIADLHEREAPASENDVLSSLSEERKIRFRGAIQGNDQSTELCERDLFLQIVSVIRTKNVSKKESEAKTCMKVWHLLHRFVPRWDLTADSWRETIKRRLRPLGVPTDEIDDKIAIMCQSLRQAAVTNGSTIDSIEFLKSHGLDGRPLTHWSPLVVRGRETLSHAMRTLLYDRKEDVRSNRVYPQEQEWWDGVKPFLVISGPSGQGKTWRLAAMATRLAEEVPVVVLRSRGSAAEDKGEIERIVSQDIRGMGRPQTLEETARDVLRYAPENAERWLCVFVDGVASLERAAALWSVLGSVPGIRVVLSALEAVAESFGDSMPEQVALIEVPDFDEEELRLYVVQGDAQRFFDIDPSVREVIQRPLLASLYRRIADADWQPESEYSLYNAYYENRLSTPLRQDVPLLLPRLRKAALDVWEGGEYPWRIEQLEDLSFTDESIARLVKMGWLVPDERERYRVWHDRLLEWQIASALAKGIEDGILGVDQVATRWRASLEGESTPGRPVYGFWAMDLVWHLAQMGAPVAEDLDKLICAGEEDFRLRTALYEELLITVGPAILPSLNRRLRGAKSELGHDLRHMIPDLVARFEDQETVRSMVAHLTSSDWQLRSAGARYFLKRPSPKAIEALWGRYLSLISDKTQGYEIRENEVLQNWRERKDFYEALERCALLDPDWIERRILDADVPSHGVAALSACLRLLPNGLERWQDLRETIISRLEGSDEHERAQAAGQYRIVEDVAWLEANLKREEHGVRWASMDALVKIDPTRAIASIREMEFGDHVISLQPVLISLMEREPTATTQMLVEVMRANPNIRWIYASLLATAPAGMPPDFMDELLDSLEANLVAKESDVFLRAFRTLEDFAAPGLLDRLAARAGSRLDELIADWVIGNSALEPNTQGSFHESAIKVLRKIAGPGLTRAVNHKLRTVEPWALPGAMKLAHLRPDEETREHLRRIALMPRNVDDRLWLRDAATKALTFIQDWRAIVEILVAWHEENDRDLVGVRYGMGRLSPEDMAPALDALKDNPVCPGAIMALGFGHWEEKTGEIAELLSAKGQDSDVINACEWALFMMPSLTDDASLALARKLRRNNGVVAVDALMNQDGEQQAALLLPIIVKAYQSARVSPIDFGRVQLITSIVKFTLRKSNTVAEAQGLCVDLVVGGIDNCPHAEDLVHSLALEVRQNPEFEFLMRDPVVKAYLKEFAFRRDGGFHYVTHKLSAIRGLSVTEPALAYDATARVLRNPKAHDWKFAPDELLMYDEERAKDDLFEQLSTEKRATMRTYIGRALAESRLTDFILGKLEHAEMNIRKNAVFVLGFGANNPQVIERLRGLLDGPDAGLSDECEKSIRRIQEAHRATELVRKYLAEEDTARRWVLLDAACEAGDPGRELRGLPVWAEPLVKDAAPAIREAVLKVFKNRQEDVRKKLEREDFVRRD
jgi:hypothetical protein